VVTPQIRDRFLADHRSLEAHIDRVVAAITAKDGAETSRLWMEFNSGLLTHLDAEEAQLIPQLLGLGERDARVLIHEHRHLRARLAKLGTEVGLRTAHPDEVRNFLDELRAHAQSEDRLLYQWADAHLDEPVHALCVDALARTRRPDEG
jgi:hemerythrin superfamily protein